METVRIELHMTKVEANTLNEIATAEGRSRKNFCEVSIRSIIQSFERGEKKIKKKKTK